MKYASNDRGIVPVLVVILVAVLVVAVGVAVYNVSKSNHKDVNTSATSPTPVPTSGMASSQPTPTPTPSDTDMIVAAVKAHLSSSGQTPVSGTKIILSKLQGDDAMVNVSGPAAGGVFELLKKNQGSWSVVFDGQNISPATESSLGFPQGFSSTGLTNTVLYTY